MIRSPVVEVAPRRAVRSPAGPSSSLPPAVLTALRSIVADMRDISRDCIRGPAELVLWFHRMSGRVEGVSRMTVPGATSFTLSTRSADRSQDMVKTTIPSSQKVAIVAANGTLPARDLHGEDTFRLSGRALADAVFGKGSHTVSTPSRRTVTSRKGRPVLVETVHSAVTQFEMFP